MSPRVKWIVSSRNWPDIEAHLTLASAQMRLSLALNAEHISRAVELFINYKVSQLELIKHEHIVQEQVRNQMHAKPNGTFLWVALVVQEQYLGILAWIILACPGYPGLTVCSSLSWITS
jgi:hypothetical protein